MFILGFCVGIIVAIVLSIAWGHRLSIEEEEKNKELIKDFTNKYFDKYVESDEIKLDKRYES
tara:strand:- start:1055 stop:1240 length:186 start_codon:yes stop_codon:yes gene_type:complete